MNLPTITALAAIFGSLVGGFTSSLGTWITQWHQGRRQWLAKILSTGRSCIPILSNESARLLVDAFGHDADDPKNLIGDAGNLIPVYALSSRIRLGSSATILTAGQEVVNTIINDYREPDLTPQQIEVKAINGDDPLKNFSDVCRLELESIRREL